MLSLLQPEEQPASASCSYYGRLNGVRGGQNSYAEGFSATWDEEDISILRGDTFDKEFITLGLRNSEKNANNGELPRFSKSLSATDNSRNNIHVTHCCDHKGCFFLRSLLHLACFHVAYDRLATESSRFEGLKAHQQCI